MSVISISHLSRHYQIHKKEPGFIGSLKSLFARKYEMVKAVDDISFSIDEGEVIGFIGPNGAGKTTTLKCLSGLLYPTSGKLSVIGFTPFDRKHSFLKQISLVMGQKNQLWWDLPAMDTFLLNKEIYQIPTKRFTEVVEDLSVRLSVKDILHVPVRKLSLGQRMKMELIAALLHSPRVLFLDEPTIGLHYDDVSKLIDILNRLVDKGNSVILIEHNLDIVKSCDWILDIGPEGGVNGGKLIAKGTPENVAANVNSETGKYLKKMLKK